jgi:hypothetical protein
MGCTQNVELYGQTKVQTANIRLSTNAIRFEFLISIIVQKIVMAVRDKNKELTSNPTVTNGETDRRVAT